MEHATFTLQDIRRVRNLFSHLFPATISFLSEQEKNYQELHFQFFYAYFPLLYEITNKF